jgi:hypothetical protein
MTDKAFAKWFKTLTLEDKWKWLEQNLRSVVVKSGRQEYGLNDPTDLNAMIEQELYQEKTGRE